MYFLSMIRGGCMAGEEWLPWSYTSQSYCGQHVQARVGMPPLPSAWHHLHGRALTQVLCFVHGNTTKRSSGEFTFPLLVPHTQKKSSQQRKQIAYEQPERGHQARRTGAEIQRKGSAQVSSWRVSFWWTLLTEVPAGRAQQVSIVNPAIHLNADSEDLPSAAT